MKKLMFLAPIMSIAFSSSSYAFDVVNHLNPKIPYHFRDLKTNMDSGCQIRNPFSGNCTVFWAQFNEYLITRGNIFNEAVGQDAGYATIPITCHIIRHKLDFVTNPHSTNKRHKTGDEVII